MTSLGRIRILLALSLAVTGTLMLGGCAQPGDATAEAAGTGPGAAPDMRSSAFPGSTIPAVGGPAGNGGGISGGGAGAGGYNGR